jgi:hypothetical protein
MGTFMFGERQGPDYLGINTVSMTSITPFDWYTSYVVMLAAPPFSSATMMLCEPFILNVSVPPLTALSVALPCCFLINLVKAAKSYFPDTT